MATELSRLLEQEAKAEKDKALADARVRADEILAAARRDAEGFLEVARYRLATERVQEIARATSTASLRAAALVLAAKDEAIQAVFARAEADLRTAAADPARRRAMITTYLGEAARDLTPGHVVEVSTGDAEAARDAANALGLSVEVRENANLTNGVRLVSADGRSVVENALGGRLARARREFVSRVAEVLWGA
ncbi:MAG TPA: V-type ATP synthase subunit E [bacterium]|nr:V-type ATP synthase subunit E [bacterium]